MVPSVFIVASTSVTWMSGKVLGFSTNLGKKKKKEVHHYQAVAKELKP